MRNFQNIVLEKVNIFESNRKKSVWKLMLDQVKNISDQHHWLTRPRVILLILFLRRYTIKKPSELNQPLWVFPSKNSTFYFKFQPLGN